MHALPSHQTNEGASLLLLRLERECNMAKQALKEALMAVMDGNNNNVASN